ncbi:MAG: hypothetical protein ABI222_15940 [Opitutaceae bacterium]
MAIPLNPATFPARPAPIIEIGQNPFLGNGYIAPGFVIPTGAVWQPVFIAYGTYRTALQTFDGGSAQITEWANRLDLYGNLYLTPTERILVGLRPLDTGGQGTAGTYSGYNFKPKGENVNAFNAKVTTAFFEGDFGELFPGLDPNDSKSLDYGFAIGRQNLVSQDGILMNDTMDAVGVTRSSLFALGSTAAHITALYGWNNITRGTNVRDDQARMYGLLTAFDYPAFTIETDLLYVAAPVNPQKTGGDGFYGGIGITCRYFGLVNNTIRVLTSQAVNQVSNTATTGTLIFNQLSITPPHSEDLIYWDTFLGIDNFSSAARDPDVGGPLGQVGLLYAGAGIGNYGAPLNTNSHNSVGTALGYQMYFNDRREQLILEIGGFTATKGPQMSTEAVGATWQQAVGRHFVIVLSGFAGKRQNVPSSFSNLYGLRSELITKF